MTLHRIRLAVALALLVHLNRCYGNVSDFGIAENDTDEHFITVSPEQARHDWKLLETRLKSNLNTMMKNMLPNLIKTSSESEISDRCVASMLKFIIGLKQMKSWAFRMVDAWGKPPGGVLYGVLSSLGSYDECVDIEVPEGTSRIPSDPIRGKYCLIHMHPSVPPKKQWISIHGILPDLQNLTTPDMALHDFLLTAQSFYHLSLRIGACVPSTCTKLDVMKFGKEVSTMLGLVVRVSVPRCEVKEPLKLDNEQVAIISVFAVLGFIILTGTLVDIAIRLGCKYKTGNKWLNPDSLFIRILVAFSGYTNTLKLFNTKTPPGTLTVIHGMRFLSISWIVLCHTYFYINLHTWSRMNRSREIPFEFGFQIINNGFVAVDTFFFISGLLVAYWRMNSKQITLNIPLYIFHRIWRLVPATLLCIGIVILLPTLGSGPVWHETLNDYVQTCRENWWLSILFVNNFVNVERMCMEHTWFMAADTQMYVLFLIVLLPLTLWPKFALILNGIILVASAVATFLINYYFNLPPAGLISYSDPEDYYFYTNHQYFKPYAHVAIYSIGIVVGYFLVTRQKLKISPMVQVVCWVSTFVFGVTMLFGIFEWNKGTEIPTAVTALYVSTSRIIWGLCLSWITIACIYGYGGFVKGFLSWKFWIPLSRLSFLIYLLHPTVQRVYAAYAHARFYGDHIIMVYMFCGHLMVSVGLAYLCSIAVESPFMALEKIMFRKKDIKNESLPFNGSANPSNNRSNITKSYNHAQVNHDKGADNPGFVSRL